MTLGEKIKEARRSAGLTQEELARKLLVSRQAVTKWEANRGLPDVENLKSLAGLLGVSIDYLLDEGERLERSVIREEIDLSGHGRWKKMGLKDEIVREKYPDDTIYRLAGIQKNTRQETAIDVLVGILTDAPFGLPELINSVKNMDRSFYLVARGERQFFVVVTDQFIESRELVERVSTRRRERFSLGQFEFINAGPIAYA